jgi:hypothetical protein
MGVLMESALMESAFARVLSDSVSGFGFGGIGTTLDGGTGTWAGAGDAPA